MDNEPSTTQLFYNLIIHPSLLSLRLLVSLVTVPLSFLLAIVLFPLRIILLPVTSSYNLFSTTITSSTDPPTPFQFLLCASFVGLVAGFALVIVSRIVFIAVGAFSQNHIHIPPTPAYLKGQSFVPSPRKVRKRILQQVKEAQELQAGIKDLPPTATAPAKASLQPKAKPEERSASVGFGSTSETWEDKWRQQQKDRREARQLATHLPPLSPSAGTNLTPSISRNTQSSALLPSSHTIVEEDSDEIFYDDETDEA